MSNGADSRYGVEIHQAAGTVSIPADCDLEQDFVLMSDRATVAHLTRDAIAAAGLDHSSRFDPDSA